MIKKAVSSLETELRSEKISKLSSSVTSIETELDNLKESLRTIIQINVDEKAGDRSTGNKKALNDVEDGLNKIIREVSESRSKALEAQNDQYEERRRQLRASMEALNSLQQIYSQLGQLLQQSQQQIQHQIDIRSEQIQTIQSAQCCE